MPDSKAHVVLDAIHFATETKLDALRQLIAQKQDILHLELVLRILLTFLPESTQPSAYIPLLQELTTGALKETEDATFPRPTKDISREEARKRIRHVRLVPLKHNGLPLGTTDLAERFLLCRAYRIDEEIGSLDLIVEFLEPFRNGNYTILAKWAASITLPLRKLGLFDVQDDFLLSLETMSSLHGRVGLQALLSAATTIPGHDFSGILRTVVGPWLLSQIDLRQAGGSVSQAWFASFQMVYDWLLNLASIDYQSVVNTYIGWLGPKDIDFGGWVNQPDDADVSSAIIGYQQLAIALVYSSSRTAQRQQVDTVIRIAAERAGIALPETLTMQSYHMYRSMVSDTFLSSVSQIHLTHGELLDATNPLTVPNDHAFQFAQLLLVSAILMDALGHNISVGEITSLALFGPPATHSSLCSKIIHNLPALCGNDDKAWIESRQKLLWLHDWNSGVQPGQPRQGVLSQVVLSELHTAFLESAVSNGRYKITVDLYCRNSSPLDVSKVKDSLINVVLAAYDNASNGNKTRGGIKKALEIITTFQPHFPEFQRLAAIQALIQATHRLSFYSLTLQHGVPLLPVNIRIYPEPLTLIEKVLKQNSRSYTKLDDLLDIGKDLVKAGRIDFPAADGTIISQEEALHEVEQTIIASAISASLSEDDFDTAYSYIVNRLSNMSSTERASSSHLWQAAYQAGRFTSHRSTTTSPSSLRRLEQRMELLSQALLLAPNTSLQEVLATWQNCEQDLNTALAHESQEEDAWQAKGDRSLPGGFSREDIAPTYTKARESTRRAMEEEAPMGLFDVARGAAAALSKSAFPLRAGAERTSGESIRSDDHDMPQRVRKRDMVSNMVTGGLASGIGWVIGAQPVKEDG